MEEEIFVSCHAPSLSILLYETARSPHDQKGLLIGEICNEVISRKTDENEANCERKTVIYLEHCIPLEDQELFGNAGSINKNRLQKYLNILRNKVIGWYSFRRNSRLVPNSLTEMLIHQSLLELVPNTKCQYFVACFMSSNVAANKSTHVFNHIFMTFDPNRGRFEPLRLKIYTLSDKSVNSNGYVVRNLLPTSVNFDKIISYVQKEETPVKSILAIQERVGKVLKMTDEKLQEIETHKVQLESEIENLKKRLAFFKKEDIIAVEPEKEDLPLKPLQFDAKVKYNPNRKSNPLKTVPAPNEEEKQKRGSFPSKNSGKRVSGKISRNFNPTNCDAGDCLDGNVDNQKGKTAAASELSNTPKSDKQKSMDC